MDVKMNKKRATILIDYNVDGGFQELKKKYDTLHEKLELFCKSDSEIVHFSMDMKERRGDKKPDVKEFKFRKN